MPSPTRSLDGWFYLSTSRMTVAVEVRGGVIVTAPPIVRKFLGQPPSNLARWLRRQPGFKGSRV